jgi:hypothetical protein
MPDETKAETPTQPEAVPTGTPTTETVAPPTPAIEKTQEAKPKLNENGFTDEQQAKVNQIVAERLRREKMDKAEKLELELKDRQAELEKLKQENVTALRKAELAGKVSDVDYALWAISQSEAEFVKDAKISLEALLAKYPLLKGQKPQPNLQGPNPPGGGAPDFKSMSSDEFAKVQARVAAGERVTT